MLGVGGGAKLQFSDRRLQISDKGVMGAENFNFVPKLPPDGGILAPYLEFLDDRFFFGQEYFPTS